jgi:serine phosphatase RsbU (regulator of sigma subunit)/ligand-binding sensor domain-containing protein
MIFKKSVFTSLVLLIFAASSFANSISGIGVPAIRSYDLSMEGIRVNWSIVQDKRGVMFFGVKGGIQEFNDYSDSRLILIPNNSAVRSLCLDDNGIIYIGARQEFGYLKPDSRGKLEYESLLPKLDSIDRNFTEVCKVYNTTDGICFQTFEALYFYKNNKFRVVKSSTSFHFSFYLNNVLYVLERGVGLDKYENGKLLLVPGGEEFSGDRIYSILPYQKNKLLIASRERGFFIYDLNHPTGNITPFAKLASKFIVENHIYVGVKRANNSFVFGTLQGGLLMMNEQGEVLKVLDRFNFMDDNKVNDLYLDKYGDLWLAQDNEVSIVELNTPFKLIKDKNGFKGKIQALERFKDRIYVSTPFGVFYKNLAMQGNESNDNADFEQLDLKTECFNFMKAKFGNEEKLYVASISGLYEITDKGLNLILGEYCYCAYQSRSNPNRILVGLKNGFAVLTKSGAGWLVEFPDNNIKDEIKSIAEDHLGNFWLVAEKEGIYQIQMKTLDHLNSLGSGNYLYTRFDTSDGLPDVIYNKVFPYNDDVVFGTIDQFFIFDYSTKRFRPFEKLNSVLGESVSQIANFTQIKNDQFLIYAGKQNESPLVTMLDTNENGKLTNYVKAFGRMLGFTVNTFNVDLQNTAWMGSNVGIVMANLESVKNNSSIYQRKYNTVIRKVSIGVDSVIFYGVYYEKKNLNGQDLFNPLTNQPADFIPKIDYSQNSIAFNYSYSFNEPSEFNYYSYFLEGYDTDWKMKMSETSISYNNLSEGRYRFHLKAKNIYGTESDETIYEFVILPPWYRTVWAYLCYAILAGGFVYLVVQISVRRLKRAKQILEKTVKERTSEIVKQNEEIQKQKDIVEIKNKDITDSINYAKRIQDTILPPDDNIKSLLPDSFILYLPKDILSGDFYWVDEIDDKVLIAAVDCTGHGVPGALMSIVGSNILSQSINEHRLSTPSAILDELNKGVTNTLRQKNEESEVKDGMDIVLLAIDKSKMILEFAAANNPLYHIRNGNLTEIKGNKFPIGIFIGEELKHFTNHTLELQKGDTIYLFTDGYADQFGGPLGKKFKYNQFKSTILKMQNVNMSMQRETLFNSIKNWQGENEQVDDILVIGISI